MQEARIDPVEALEFSLNAHQKALIAAEPEVPCHRRARTIGAENETRLKVEPGKTKPTPLAFGAREPRPVPALRQSARPACL